MPFVDGDPRHGLVHRDIKGENLFVGRRGAEYDFLKVLDFGIAKQAEGNETAKHLTQERQFLGTVATAAPETIAHSQYGPSSDLYFLGCVAYTMVTGKSPFPGPSRVQMVYDQLNTEPLSPSSVCGFDLPLGLEDIVFSCLQKDPAGRLASAADLWRQFDGLALDACACRSQRRLYPA